MVDQLHSSWVVLLTVVPSRAELRIAAWLIAVHAAHKHTRALTWCARHTPRGKVIRRDELRVLRQPDSARAATAVTKRTSLF